MVRNRRESRNFSGIGGSIWVRGSFSHLCPFVEVEMGGYIVLGYAGTHHSIGGTRNIRWS